jgi:hemerythrin superfamily protein
VGQGRINGKNIYKIMKDYNEEDENSIYPFTSWVLSTNDYENFIH